ncbi:MAG: hypothetical protein ABIP06_14050 [Pyrinomonadaceae bacterium]
MRKPNSPAGETWTILEKIFAPLQAALLALARSAEVWAVILAVTQRLWKCL